jgi:hypothetical protein
MRINEILLGEFKAETPLTARQRAAIKARDEAFKKDLLSKDWPAIIKEARRLYDTAKPNQKDNMFSYLCTCISQSMVK